MEAHRVNGTWQIVKLPPGKRAIGFRWFLKVKHNADGSLDRYKVRLVAKGYSQCPGFDFHETFAPTVRYSTLHIILALFSCWKRWALESQRTKGTAEEQMRLILKSEIATY